MMSDFEWLRANPKYLDILRDAVEHEESLDPDDFEDDLILENYNEKNGTDYCVHWENTDIPHHPTQIYQLETHGFLERVFDSNSTTRYSIPNRREVKKRLEDLDAKFDGDSEVVMHGFPDMEDLDGIFDDVVGYEDVKWLLKKALSSDDIVNILLIGPPGCGKTVFLRCIRRLEGASFVSGKRTSEAGFTDKMFDDLPRFMCIDELDDMDDEHQQSLSDYTEEGVIVETKGNDRRRELRTNTKTFASGNYTDNIIDQIENRFTDLHFDKYTLDEFKEVCRSIIPRDYGHDEEKAEEIAEAVWEMDGFANVRKAEDVASLSRDADPKKVVKVLENYSPNSGGLLG